MENVIFSTNNHLNYNTAKDMMISYTKIFNFPVFTSLEMREILMNNENKDKFIIVDCRTSDERNISMIPCSISKEEFENKLLIENESSFFNQLIIIYCTIGYRSGVYCNQLEKKGFNNLKNSEGIILYTFYCEDLVKEIILKNKIKQYIKVKDVHVYGEQWKLQSDHFKSVQFSSLQMFLQGLSTFFYSIFSNSE
jgi:rhodanese-related sulfurtransferase